MLLIFYISCIHLIYEDLEKTPLYRHMLKNCIQMTRENQRFIEVRCNEDSGLCCTIVDAMENMG